MDGDGYRGVQMQVDGTPVDVLCWLAVSGHARRKGLSGLNELPEGHALLIPGAPIIHMVGMRFPLDLVFISPNRRIVKVVQQAEPGLRLLGSPRSWFCLELNVGEAEKFGFVTGASATWVPLTLPA